MVTKGVLNGKKVKTNNSFFSKKDGSGTFFPKNNPVNNAGYSESAFFTGNVIQRKLNIGNANDKFEREADAVAENLLRKDVSHHNDLKISKVPDVQLKCRECEKVDRKDTNEEPIQRSEKINHIQREEDDPRPTMVGPSAIDWFEMSRPFYNRGATSLISGPVGYSSVVDTWMRNYSFFNQLLRLSPDTSVTATNFFTPFTIDAGLINGYPNLWDLSDREMNTSSLVLSPTIMNFDISTGAFTMPWPLRNLFGLPENPYKLQRKSKSGETDTLNRKGKSSAGQQNVPPIVNETLRESGKAIEGNTLGFMEDRMGYDFSKVKIHTGPSAAKSAQSINALAYTSGADIVFNDGMYSPQTTIGKKLLAHELTHVVQQNHHRIDRKKIQRQALPLEDPIHGPLLDRFSAETGIPRDQASQHSPEYRQWLRSTAPPPAQTTSVNIDQGCNRSDIIDIVQQSLTWLDDVYNQLLGYDADEVFANQIPTGGDHARIAAALQQAFNTTDITYAEVIRRRFLHLANTLRTNGRITINCNGQYCSAGGSSFTAAYVSGPYAMTMCSVGTASSRPIATFIHELIHAIIPRVGISADVTQRARVTDRAYRGDRAFSHLSPEETLDNADSYGILAELLHSRTNTQLVTPQGDTTQQCAQPDVVLEAFARADQWNHFALHQLDIDVNYLHGRTLNNLAQGNLDLLNDAFSSITTTSQLQTLKDAFQRLKRSGFGAGNWDFRCVDATDSNCGSSVAYSIGGKVNRTSVSLQNIRINETVRLCPGWFNLSHDDKTKTIYAAFMIGRPTWIVAGFQLPHALDYAEGARVLKEASIPAPTATSASEHIERDRRYRSRLQTAP